MVGGDLVAECVKLPVFVCEYTYEQKAAMTMTLLTDPRCRFEDQDAVQKPVFYATAAGDFDGDKGMTPVVNNRPGVPSNRDCEQGVNHVKSV